MYKHWVENLLLTALAILLPIKPMLIMVGVLAFTDLITGVMAAKKRGEIITSRGLRQTVKKLLIYEVALIFGFLVEKYMMEDLIPVSKILGTLIGITELKSLLENLDTIGGNQLFQTAIKQVVSQSGISKEDIDKATQHDNSGPTK